jgi:hypothetical protein
MDEEFCGDQERERAKKPSVGVQIQRKGTLTPLRA